MKASIVLGLGFGDEGKGMTVNSLCADKSKSTIVIRFSGGQQAGHTVIKDGIKHIHSNYGAGTLKEIPSYFTEHTTIYLNTIANEEDILRKKGISPKLFVHPLAKITTPYDVAYGRVLEERNNHGSVGLGVGATMKRHTETGYKLFAIDLSDYLVFRLKVNQIKRYYLNKLAGDQVSLDKFNSYLEESEDYFFKLSRRELFGIFDYSYLKNYFNLVFEGSQGIMLDMDHGIFPHVTFANTTSKNAIEVCDKLGIDHRLIDIFYVTRCYQTRHGNGPMTTEDERAITLINNEEEINVFNDWQKDFRIAEIDYKLLNYAVRIDKLYSGERTTKHIVVTCLDQRPGFEFNYEKLDWKFNYVYENSSPAGELLGKLEV